MTICLLTHSYWILPKCVMALFWLANKAYDSHHDTLLRKVDAETEHSQGSKTAVMENHDPTTLIADTCLCKGVVVCCVPIIIKENNCTSDERSNEFGLFSFCIYVFNSRIRGFRGLDDGLKWVIFAEIFGYVERNMSFRYTAYTLSTNREESASGFDAYIRSRRGFRRVFENTYCGYMDWSTGLSDGSKWVGIVATSLGKQIIWSLLLAQLMRICSNLQHCQKLKG